jgi:hypothetical protein
MRGRMGLEDCYANGGNRDEFVGADDTAKHDRRNCARNRLGRNNARKWAKFGAFCRRVARNLATSDAHSRFAVFCSR